MSLTIPRIWLIGGTSEGLRLAQLCSQAQVSCTVSVTTAMAAARYPQGLRVRVAIATFTPSQLEQFLDDEAIVGILDASHPHAQQISQLAMQAATRHGLPYLRFERPAVSGEENPWVTEIDSIQTFLAERHWVGRQVLLLLGAKALPLFESCHAQCTLFARILPHPAALQTALQAGFAPERLIALRPPITYDLERALWQQWQIQLAVTKASGQPGGEAVKRRVAETLKTPLVVIQRPLVEYPQITAQAQVALDFCQRALRSQA